MSIICDTYAVIHWYFHTLTISFFEITKLKNIMISLNIRVLGIRRVIFPFSFQLFIFNVGWYDPIGDLSYEKL